MAEQSEEQRGEVVAAGRVAAEVLARHEHAGAEHGAALQAAEVRPGIIHVCMGIQPKVRYHPRPCGPPTYAGPNPNPKP